MLPQRRGVYWIEFKKTTIRPEMRAGRSERRAAPRD
jgi:hypothetical protein